MLIHFESSNGNSFFIGAKPYLLKAAITRYAIPSDPVQKHCNAKRCEGWCVDAPSECSRDECSGCGGCNGKGWGGGGGGGGQPQHSPAPNPNDGLELVEIEERAAVLGGGGVYREVL